VFRAIRALPFFRVLIIAQLALLAREHVMKLQPMERRRLWELVRNARHLTPVEKDELRGLAIKLEPRAFATGAARHMSPFGRRGRFGL
jgi:hypothetical protein